MSSKNVLFNKTSKQKTMGLASSLLTSMFNWVNEDGSLGDSSDGDLLTHHLLLVLSAWQNENLKGVEDRAVSWFINYDDYREKKDNDFNPFKLMAFSSLNRADLKEYIKLKTKVMRDYHSRDGYVILHTGFTNSKDLKDVFPTLMGTSILISEGSTESIKLAMDSLLWSRNQINDNKVYENVYSINGFAALVTSLYEQATKDTEFNSWRDSLVEQVISLQKNGLWQVEEKGKLVESKYQSSYLFYDLAYILSLNDNDNICQAVSHLIERLHTDLLEGDEVNGQHAVLIIASVLRGLAFLFSSEEKDNIVQNVVDSCIQTSGEFSRNKNMIYACRADQERWRSEIKKGHYIYTNPTVFHEREFQEKEKQVFVVMPFGKKKWFDKEKNDVIGYDFDRVHTDIIKKAIEVVGLNALRADDIYAPHSFMQKIWQDINKSCLVIVDLTSENPNVFYELGIAHTLGKPVVLLAKEERYIPTDLKGAGCVIYEDETKSDEVVIKELSKAIKDLLQLA